MTGEQVHVKTSLFDRDARVLAESPRRVAREEKAPRRVDNGTSLPFTLGHFLLACDSSRWVRR